MQKNLLELLGESRKVEVCFLCMVYVLLFQRIAFLLFGSMTASYSDIR